MLHGKGVSFQGFAEHDTASVGNEMGSNSAALIGEGKMDVKGSPVVSLYVPFTGGKYQTRHFKSSLSTLLRRVGVQLEGKLSSSAVEIILNRIRTIGLKMRPDPESVGVAIFVSSGYQKVLELNRTKPEPTIHVGQDYLIEPLLRDEPDFSLDNEQKLQAL